LYRCENTGVAERGICKFMKAREKEIDGGMGARETDSQKWLSHFGEWVDGSLWVSERRPCGHEGDLAFVYTIQVRVLSRELGPIRSFKTGMPRGGQLETEGKRRKPHLIMQASAPTVEGALRARLAGNAGLTSWGQRANMGSHSRK